MSSDWRTVCLGEILQQVKRPELVSNMDQVPFAGVRWYAEGVYHRDTVRAAEVKTKVLQRIQLDDVVYNRMWATKASFGRVTDDAAGCLVTNDFPIFVVDPTKALAAYVELLFRQKDFQAAAAIAATGTTERRRLNEREFIKIPILLPSLDEQRRIVDMLAALDEAVTVSRQTLAGAEHAFRMMLSEAIRPKGNGLSLDLVAENLDTQRIPVSAAERQQRPGTVPYYGAAGQTGWIDEPIFNEPLVCLGEDGNGLLKWQDRPIAYRIDGPAWVNNHAHVLRATRVSTNWLMLSLMHQDISLLLNEGTRPKLNKGVLGQISIRVDDTAEDEARLMAFLEVIKSQDAANKALSQLRSEVAGALLTAVHKIPETYDELMGA